MQDHETHSPKSNELFALVAKGEIRAYCPITAIFETIHIVHKLYGADRSTIRNYWHSILLYPGLITDHVDAIREALNFWVEQSPLDFADCYHLALTRHLGLGQIYSFDKKMDRFPCVKRIEL